MEKTGYLPSTSAFTATGSQQAAVRPTEVLSEMAGLDKNLEELLSQVQLLEDRLAKVLRPVGPTEPSVAANAAEPSVLLAQDICGFKRRVAAIGGRVASILDRIEL